MVVGLLKKFKDSQARALLPKRKKTDSKVAGGRSLIIAGSKGMLGAAVLSATAAARVGSGYVILMTDRTKFSSVRYPDFLVADWKDQKIKNINFSAIGIGPGLGSSHQSLHLLRELLRLKVKNVVIDADALNLCYKYKLYPLPKSWIATPHEGELARFLKISSSEIKKNRKKFILKAVKKLKCIVLLKGFKTLVAQDQNIYEIQTGNKSLAKAGTGDVLTGMITGFLAQSVSSQEAACLGAYVHGWMADQWQKDKNDELSLMASDLLDLLPKALYQIRKKEK